MQLRWFIVGLLMMTLVTGEEEPVPPVAVEPPVIPNRMIEDPFVISRSKQFKISGGDAMARGVAAIFAEEAKDELLRLLEEPDGWKIPIAIVLHGKLGDPVPPRTTAMQFLIVEKSYRLQLDKHLGVGMEPVRFKQVVTAMLIYERSLRANPEVATDHPMSVPPWLAVGMREASAWKMNRSDRALYAALFKRGGLFKLEELFALDEAGLERMDTATRASFQVSAGSLVMALLEQAQGKQGFREFLNKVTTYQGEIQILLREHFPGLNLSKDSLAKWWALQLANQGDLNLLTDVMGIAETEDAMAQALMLDIPAEGGSVREGIESWVKLVPLKPAERLAATKYAQAAVVHLSYRCFPSYRPLLMRYQEVLYQLSRNETKGVASAIEGLKKDREVIIAKASRGRDYLDWFEITRARQTSGAFDDYLRLKDELKTRKTTREDSISGYLDRMNEVFERGENK